ncbi:putative transketolase N-terminal section [Petrocella atlantisensis]|uniref:Putative transketolase N-terminal section n=1 Tax=Petrocella atlantisensis TaxID=2173034 RepID=A0A3P7Q0G5_9FIRM|nr:transketolase [Petrocella atlantisensis]VDN48901.1 putative transketolase N-terminal section [Petrocella atlantisensis]
MNDKIAYLEEKARELRTTILTMIHAAGSGHPGGSLSAADYVTVLYYDEMHIDPQNPKMEDRDRFILSKGHSCPVLYSVLAQKGYYDYEIIHTLRKFGSILQGHPDMNKVPGVDMTTGSLGQGLSVGAGMAIGLKSTNNSARVFVSLGDGEINEGQVWEAACTASKYKLDNLVAIVDFNGIQNDSFTKDIMPMDNIADKWKSFGWEVMVCDGHDISDLVKTFEEMKAFRHAGRPICIVANTIKGKGVSFMEHVPMWHGVAPNKEEFTQALSEINGGDCNV